MILLNTVATTSSDLEEETPLYRSNLQKVMEIFEVWFIAAATRNDKNLKPIEEKRLRLTETSLRALVV